MKRGIAFLMIAFSAVVFAGSEMEIEGLKYRKEKSIDIEIYFPKKIPDYFDNLMNYEDGEALFELAKNYLILDKITLADRYIAEYEKKSPNLLQIAKYYYTKGDAETGDKYINRYISKLSIDERLQNYGELKALIKKYGIVIDESKIFVSNLELLLNSESEAKFIEIYESIGWTADEKKAVAGYLSARDLEKSEKLKKIFYSIAEKEQIRNYYYNRIKTAGDIDAYNIYFEKGEKGEFPLEIKNEIEKMVYLKYKGKDEEFNRLLETEKNDAVLEKDYEKLYLLLKIEGSREINGIYNLALQNDKYCYLLISDIENGTGIIQRGSEEHKNLLDAFITYYPASRYLDEVFTYKADMSTDPNEKLIITDEILVKRFVYPIFVRKLRALNALQRYNEAEIQGRNYLEKNYPFKEVVEEVIIAMEKQDKQKELITLLDMLPEKGYYYEYSEKTKSTISQREKRGLANYYFTMRNYPKLLQMKDVLDYEQLMTLTNEGKIEFKEWAAQKYPFERKWNDISKQQFIIFNNEFVQFSEEIVKKLEAKSNRSDAEKYYLARYYSYKGDYKKSTDIFEDFVNRYKIYNEIIEAYINTVEKSGDKKKAQEIRNTNRVLLEWQGGK